MLHASVTALLEALAAIEGQIARLDEQLKELVRRSPVCWRLMSVPGVGPIVALVVMAAIEDINRFRRMRSVGAYLGLTTRRYHPARRTWCLASRGRGTRWRAIIIRGRERAPDHGQEAIGAQELGAQADEAARAEAGARRGGAQARHPLGTNLER
jgi:transposase